MYQFFHDHVGFVESITGGFQVGISWGMFFGIPVTLFGLWMFNKVSKMWHKFAASAQPTQ